MTDIQRVSKVIKWLIFNDFAENDRDLAAKLGYNVTYFSQIKSGKTKISEQFIERLCESDVNLNKIWVLNGKGEMLRKNEAAEKKLIPLYNAGTIGGTSRNTSLEPVSQPSEWIDAGDWFKKATAAIHHYGDSMTEYPSGCILALREILNYQLIVWGKNYVIETDEYRITKRLQRGENSESIKAYSSNMETYGDGTLIHEPINIPINYVRRIYLVLGYVVKEESSGHIYRVNNF
jgi:transcriptional regulator with XRE-family HTH domain